MLVRKYIYTLILILGLLFAIKRSFGQYHIVDSSNNKPKRIAFTEFYRRIERATELLQTKELSAISDKDHINIMMCLNTIFLNDFDQRFNDTICKRFLAVANEKDYKHKIANVYPEWLFNRGMGQYYQKLKMELYGTPNVYAKFIISN